MKCLWIGVVLAACTAGTLGQGGSDAKAIMEFPHYKLREGNLDSYGLPTSGAKLCVDEAAGDCFQMPSNGGYSKGSVVYDYGLTPEAKRVPVEGGGSLVLFSAMFSGGGSGTLDSLSILRFDEGGKIVNLLPFVGVTNQSERSVWSVPQISKFPILVTADADWDSRKETHFSRHFFVVEVYRFDTRSDRYSKLFEYRTAKKYPSLDEVDEVRVIEPERQEIMRRLKSVSRPPR